MHLGFRVRGASRLVRHQLRWFSVPAYTRGPERTQQIPPTKTSYRNTIQNPRHKLQIPCLLSFNNPALQKQIIRCMPYRNEVGARYSSDLAPSTADSKKHGIQYRVQCLRGLEVVPQSRDLGNSGGVQPAGTAKQKKSISSSLSRRVHRISHAG